MSISEELGRNLVQLAQRWLKRPSPAKNTSS